MSNDWDVIEELEFWDDYHAIYGPEPISRRKQKKINKYKKRKAKEAARKQKESEERIAKRVAENIKAEENKKSSSGDDAAEGCGTILAAAVVIIVIAVICFTSCVQGDTLKPTDKGWKLKWSDEFNDKKLNEDAWTYDLGTGFSGWGNNELESYTDREKNIKLKDGKLVIHAIKEKYGSADYTSARIKTMYKKAFKYGKIEARFKVVNGNQSGVWPAFWMMGNDGLPWPNCGELDIMEHANDRDYASGAIHWMSHDSNMMWSGMFNGHVYKYPGGLKKGINKWHTYGIVWGANHIDWYVDNNIYFAADIKDSNAAAFRKEHYFLLNLAIGSNQTGYTGFTGPKKNFKPATMYVDYVRVFENKDKSYTKAKPRKIVESDKLDTFALQFNKKKVAVRVRSFVESTIHGHTISTNGIILGIKSTDGKDDTGITSDDLNVDNDGGFIRVFQNESEDIENLELQKHDTATYYNTDIVFENGLKKHSKEKFYVRPYTIMDDGSYLYGKVKLIDIAELNK